MNIIHTCSTLNKWPVHFSSACHVSVLPQILGPWGFTSPEPSEMLQLWNALKETASLFLNRGNCSIRTKRSIKKNVRKEARKKKFKKRSTQRKKGRKNAILNEKLSCWWNLFVLSGSFQTIVRIKRTESRCQSQTDRNFNQMIPEFNRLFFPIPP